VIAAEDGRFFQHGGLDWFELQRVVEESQKHGRVSRGASTITQQLVKNLFLTTHSAWWRKALEVPLALLAELILPKRRILELYLNVVEWGPGIYGAEAAARSHYGASAAALGREQAARLAALLPAPRQRRPERMNRYAAIILRRMASHDW
jgi:monofunctional biosynthetic peptidoglycan transglycosylase